MPFNPPDWMRVPTTVPDEAAADLPGRAPITDPARTSEPATDAPPRPSGVVRARIWESSSPDFLYPEQEAGIVDPNKRKTGVAFSGGGNRAMIAAWGQLRGLVESGLIEDVDYISCVSGGSWASTVFTYYSDGAANDEQLLGSTRAPGQIRLDALRQISPLNLGVGATESFLSKLVEQSINVVTRRITPNDVWIHAVGNTFFERFGVYSQRSPSFFSYDQATVDQIVARNPELAAATFDTVRNKTGDAKRPYLVINSTLMWPTDGADNFIHFEYSPLAVGSKHRLTVYDPPGDENGRSQAVGGGFIEPFAFGTSAPREWPPYRGGYVDAPPSEKPFSLAYASGTSSAAFAATGAGLAGGYPLVSQYLAQGPPVERYWPVPATGGSSAPQDDVYAFGDGGSLDNLGVISLLLRGVESLVVFVNTERRLDVDYDPSNPDENPPSIHSLDGGIAPYFGVLPADRSQPPTPNNQVFRKEDLATVVRALQQAKGTGDPKEAIATTELEVQDNDWWGVQGGWKAKVCWVYLDRVARWESQLDGELRGLVEAANLAGPKEKAPFWGFPNYKTMFQGGKLQIIAMSVPEANLLADFTAWTTTQSPGARRIAETLRG